MWLQLKIEECHHQDIEPIGTYLEEHQALSLMYTDKNDNPILEPELGTTPLWPEVIIHALYRDAITIQQIKDELIILYPYLRLTIEILPEQNWEQAWMADFKPQQFGERLWICPTWSTPPQPDAVNLILDPGLAFGTGTHPTTALCLTWLEQAHLNDKTLIDYGCGSGILSLAAAKLGAAQITAVDIDKQALQATQNNAMANHVSQKITIIFPEQLVDDTPVDVIIANILLTPLVALKERFYELLSPQGLLVVSGLLTTQASQLITAYLSFFNPIDSREKDEWSLLVFQRS